MKGLGMASQSALLATARQLAGTLGGPPPSQANLRGAVSTTYYSLFHYMAENCANMLVGELGSGQSRSAWYQAYRALEHGLAKQRWERKDFIRRFPSQVQDFAEIPLICRGNGTPPI